MYYEEYERRPRRRRRRRRRSCLGVLIGFFFKLLVLALVLAAVAAGVLYLVPTGMLLVEPENDLALTDGLPTSPMNLLVLGVDVLDSGSQRSDAMMIASVNWTELKLTSLQRDVNVKIGDHGVAKLNAAYAYGGAEEAMRTVNELLDANLMRYAVVDFTSLVRLVDALGGVEVDITEAEMRHINQNVLNSRKVFQPLGYTASELTQYGPDTHLDGLQALGYARIRKLDSDFVRTSRQRTVIEAMLEKIRVKVKNPLALVDFAREALRSVETNLTPVELISLGSKVLFASEMRQLRLPVDGSFTDDGSSLTLTDREANVQAFRHFVYE